MKNILIKPNKENLTSFVAFGIIFISISLIDILAYTFLNINFTGFLPSKLSFFAPLIFGSLGLYLIRIEFSGNKFLDKILVLFFKEGNNYYMQFNFLRVHQELDN